MLDVGTNRQSLLDDPLYLGNRAPPRRPGDYDAFIDTYVTAASSCFPHALLHWEDFGPATPGASSLATGTEFLTFNDDVQGTGAVALAAVLAALRVTGRRCDDQRVVVFGSGTAGIGIADQLCSAMVRETGSRSMSRVADSGVSIGRALTDDRTDLRDFQAPYARGRRGRRLGARRGDPVASALARSWPASGPRSSSGRPGRRGLHRGRHPGMAAQRERPIVLPMSNPTTLAEAVPADLIAWTEGRALVATGSPSSPSTTAGHDLPSPRRTTPSFSPDWGSGRSSRATRVTDNMLFAAPAPSQEPSTRLG